MAKLVPSTSKENIIEKISGFLLEYPRTAYFTFLVICVSFVIYQWEGKIDLIHLKHEAEKETSKLAIEKYKLKYQQSFIIRRGINEDEFLDVRNMCIKDIEKPNISSNAVYHNEGGFYAISNDEFWTFQLVAGRNHNHYLTGVDKELNEISEEDVKSDSIFLWRGEDTSSVQGNNGFAVLFSHISIAKIPYGNVHNQYPNTDPATALLTHLLYDLVEHSEKDLNTEIRKVNCREDVFYLSSVSALLDCRINDEFYDQYYIHREYIMIPTDDYIFLISTFVPSPELIRNGEAFFSVSAWLNTFKVLLSKPNTS